MRNMLTMLACALLLGAVGCQSVTSYQPVGNEPATLDPAEWDGRWLMMGNWVPVRVADAENGIIEFGPPEEAEEEEAQPLRMSIRRSGDWLFLNISSEEIEKMEGGGDAEADPDEEKAPVTYLWGRVRNHQNQVTFWLPDFEKFRDLVEAGTLPGELPGGEQGDTVILKELTPEHLAMIIAGEHGVLFQWEEPIALCREAPADDAEAAGGGNAAGEEDERAE